MALNVADRVGYYDVTAKIGAGGMGEVYRAHDTTLDRDVAIKVLPEAFARPAHGGSPTAEGEIENENHADCSFYDRAFRWVSTGPVD